GRNIEIAWTRIEIARAQEQNHRADGRDRENRKSGLIAALPKQRRTDNQGPENGARLVERTVQAEAPAKPGLAARMRQHRVTRGGADRLARPLKHDQQSRKLPAARQRKERHGHKIDSVADKGDCPIAARAVGEIARNEAQSIAKE